MRQRFLHSFFAALLVGVLLAAVALAFTISRHRKYQVDEIEHIHSAFNLQQGQTLYQDFWEGHNPLLYVVLQPLIDETNPAGTFGDARLLMFCVLLGIVGLTSLAAFRLAGAPAASLAAAMLLTHTTFVERAMEIRPDPWLALAATFVLASELMQLPPLRRFLLQAFALSLAFLFTQKAVLVVGAVGLNWLLVAARQRKPSWVVLPSVAFAVPLLVAGYWLWNTGAWPKYVEYNIANQFRQVARVTNQSFGPWAALHFEGKRNLFFCVMSVCGIAYATSRVLVPRLSGFAGGSGLPTPSFAAVPAGAPTVLVLVLFLFSTLWLNPFPFPYYHVLALPGLALLGAWAVVAPCRRRAPWVPHAAGLAALGLVLVTSLPRLRSKAVEQTKHQMDFIAQVHAITPGQSSVFDLTGLHFRRDAYPVYVMTVVMLKAYKRGVFPRMIPAWRHNRLATVVHNYRTSWLGPEEKRFIDDHFIRYTDMLAVPGRLLTQLSTGETQQFEVLETRQFRFEGKGQLLVDGRPFTLGRLEPGVHDLSTAERPVSGRLIADVPPPNASAQEVDPFSPAFD